MGKGTRNRERRADATAFVESSGPYFHGGVPGKQPGDLLWPASELGLQFQYSIPEAKYDPRWVYIVADQDVATEYASRYLEAGGRELPGDVYEVQPLDALKIDPDYSVFPNVFRRCRTARITRVVTTGIALTRIEQNYLGRRYQVWGKADCPVWDENGLIIPSEQMAANGVTREWTTLLRPWLSPAEVDAKGKLSIAARSATPWKTMLESVPSLDSDCQIQQQSRHRYDYQRTACGYQSGDGAAAALHQLGARPVRLLTRIHGWDEPPVPPLVEAARARNPARWHWLAPEG